MTTNQEKNDEHFTPRKSRCLGCNRIFLKQWEQHGYCHWKCLAGVRAVAMKRLADLHNVPLEQVERWAQTRSLDEIIGYLQEIKID